MEEVPAGAVAPGEGPSGRHQARQLARLGQGPMSSFPLRKPTAETKLTAWMKVLWSVQLTSAVGVTAWASSIQPGAKYTADWVIPISGTLLLVAFVLAKRASDSSSRSGAEIPIAAAWSLGLA